MHSSLSESQAWPEFEPTHPPVQARAALKASECVGFITVWFRAAPVQDSAQAGDDYSSVVLSSTSPLDTWPGEASRCVGSVGKMTYPLRERNLGDYVLSPTLPTLLAACRRAALTWARAAERYDSVCRSLLSEALDWCGPKPDGEEPTHSPARKAALAWARARVGSIPGAAWVSTGKRDDLKMIAICQWRRALGAGHGAGQSQARAGRARPLAPSRPARTGRTGRTGKTSAGASRAR